MLSFIFLLSLFLKTYSQKVISVRDPGNITLAFGSCFNTFKGPKDTDTVLKSIVRTQSDVWMWTGDAVYLDGNNILEGILPGAGYDTSDEAYVRNIFNTLKQNPVYVELRKSLSIIGIWDDHDYAYDDVGADFKYKKRNMGIFLDFLDEPSSSQRRKRQGVYESYYIGSEKLVKVILLDVRYNMKDDDMLGSEQWAWLNSQLQDRIPAYTLIVSGMQYFPANRVTSSWQPENLDRLFDLINTHQKSGVVLISGDIHYAQFSRHPCPARVGYKNFYELVSSGMTHSAAALDHLELLIKSKFSRSEDRFFSKNFALVKLLKGKTGAKTPPDLIFEVRNANGKIVISKRIVYSDLIYNTTLSASYTDCE